MDSLSQLLPVSGFLFLITTLYLWRSKKTPTNKIKGNLAPEPSGALPIIGHLHQVNSQKPIFRTLADYAQKYGPIFRFRLGVHPVLVISNYEAVKECFTTNDVSFASRPRSAHGTLLGYDYAAFGFAPYGPYWRTMRKLTLVELLSSRRLEKLKHVHISEVETLIRDLYGLCKINGCDPTKVVISEWIEHFTLNIITEIIASKRYFDCSGGGNIDGEAQRIEKLIKEYMYISGVPVVSDLIPVPKWIDIQGRLKSMKRIGKEIDVLIGSWVEEHTGKKEKGTKTTESNDNTKQDFIDIMLSVIEDSHELGYSRETIIKATVSNLIIAGSDTTAINLTWTLALLLNNKQALNRAQEELDLKVGRERWVKDSDIKNLVYLQAIVKETLRLYPPGPLSVPHEAREDCTVCGYWVPKGTRLFVNVWKLHRDPTLWPDPDTFLPERFLTSHAEIDGSGQHFEFIPFGSGRRSCPGMPFALQVTHFTLARLLQGFEWSTPLDAPVDMTEGLGITLPRVSPVEVLLRPRLPAELYQL
ncbi:Cytochrome P450, E-class, group I [Trema orientale]|uniref:Cytochrome P450, E-class, group I n=1 Tax=Trema orientale TaxID=63057 RepID=A0A2P5CED3_TREOI|nr:Cytochrome P450, E-class, group I [Trema orientale]